MDKDKNTDDKKNEGSEFTRIFVGALVMAILLLAVKFFPGISDMINGLFFEN